MNPPGKRIKILSNSEIEEIYCLPNFTNDEWSKYFSLNPLEKEQLYNLRTIQSKVYYILQLGYFKYKNMFFNFEQEDVKEDIAYILERYYNISTPIPQIIVNQTTRLNQQTRILQLCHYKNCDKATKTFLKEKAAYLATVCLKPIYIFKELVNYLEKCRIVIPGYSTLQTIVGEAVVTERKRLEQFAKKYITKEIKDILEIFFTADQGLYELTLLRKEPKSFTWKEIQSELKKKKSISDLYIFAGKFLKYLEISNENVKYYSSLVDFYSVYKLKRMSTLTSYIYILCYIYHRYQKINDNLLNGLIYNINDYFKKTKEYVKEFVLLNKIEVNNDLDGASKVLNLFVDDKIPDSMEFGEVKQKAFGLLKKERFLFVCKHIAKISFDETAVEWDYYKKLAPTFKKNLRPSFLAMNFESQTKNDPLLEAISFLKYVFRENKILSQLKTNAFPVNFIPEKTKRYLQINNQPGLNTTSKTIDWLDADKYEFLVYLTLKNSLESGVIYCKNSLQFRSFEDELIEKKYWKENSQVILNKLDYPRLKMPIEKLLTNLEKEFEYKIIQVNNRVKNGQNKHIKITGKGDNLKWRLPYKKPEDTENHNFYSHLPQIGVGDVLEFVNEKSDFIKAFSHILVKNTKSEIDKHAIIGSIVALATNTGLITMGETSDLSFQTLHSTAKNYIRLETLKTANDIISNKISQNPFFKNYDIEDGVIHSSSDGQRIETQINTINSRYSPKYFGLKKGVTSYTLVANHVPINAKIIGSNEHESHYVFDILFNNTSDIRSDRHSTDSHGTNKTNDIILYMFDHTFAPRYAKLNNRADKIPGFNILNHYKDLFIKPYRRVKKQLIIDEADNISRIFASLALKTTTQSLIIRKLSSYARRNKTQQAIWELNDIVNGIYILDYIDDLFLRQNVQRALNRGESYHKLKKAVSYAFSGKFRVKTHLEQQIWDECSRLVCNCIIFHNIWILSELHSQLKVAGREKEQKLLENISPIGWRHINLRGNFKFKNSRTIEMDNIVHKLFNMSDSEYFIDNEEYFV